MITFISVSIALFALFIAIVPEDNKCSKRARHSIIGNTGKSFKQKREYDQQMNKWNFIKNFRFGGEIYVI